MAGCTSGNSDDTAVKLPNGAGKPLNPTGQQTPDQKAKADQISADALRVDKARGSMLQAGK
ncbi:MAG TPA: hypothetical protein VGL56_03450 [Fimbriimonadaceae bacterium]|jgi:hypothetical protein